MATIYEVSSLAGVSLATVSRVINNNARVSDKTRQKVEKAMSELGYRPNSIAQSLASNCTNSVGILVSELHGPFFGQMMAGIEAELRAAGKHVIITPGHSEEDKEKEGIDFLISRNCDALIIHVEGLTDEYLIELSKGKTPIYFMSRIIPDLKENCIYLDNELGGYLATKALIEHGHTNIAYIGGPQFKPDSQNRLTGHKRALAEHKIPFNDTLYVEGDFKETGGKKGLKHFLNAKTPFTALVCANDEMASGAMTYAREHDFSLPKDLSIIGFDNIIFSRHIYPKLTTINNPVDEMGKMAAKLVLKNVYHHKDLIINHSFDPALIERDSIAYLGK
ncbi:LacI family transcriptional regulator [Colwellia sp. MSW7]|uniref:LacI family transcriptional regulator n=1 Tax=Colwellia maritima TaxID=2912588 RepID=A0ABS9WYK6_9GAMM|nr:LacI family DNA-binding transcriptional regulator [Colwellia maritima]MCI2283054.1 LacI family transcriptional regulator [Colwellia maritima]